MLVNPTTRITTGRFKGRTLLLPNDAAVRPTRERIRQAVFNMLGSRLDWHGLTVADLCCGSGAWGLEAFSRGAAQVWLVDTDTRTARANVAALGLIEAMGVHIVQADVRTWQPPTPLDVVLADPPYGTQLCANLLQRAAQLGAPTSWWALEDGANDALEWPETFTNLAEKVYGVSKINIGQFFSPTQG